jgi:hypothetical protein
MLHLNVEDEEMRKYSIQLTAMPEIPNKMRGVQRDNDQLYEKWQKKSRQRQVTGCWLLALML